MKAILTIALVFGLTWQANANSRVIGGAPVESGEYSEVAAVSVGSARLSGVLIGPRVLVTAAHGVKDGQEVEANFNLDDSYTYKGIGTRSKMYAPVKHDHDLAIVLLDEKVEGVKPVSIGGKVLPGEEVELLGYGCTEVSGNGGNDGVLRRGTAVVIRRTVNDKRLEFGTKGAALCFGDSGGPAYRLFSSNKKEVVGIGSKGNIKDTSYFTRMDSAATYAELWSFIAKHDVEICGLNLDCE